MVIFIYCVQMMKLVGIEDLYETCIRLEQAKNIQISFLSISFLLNY